MIAHYFAVAFASFRKAPFATAANVLTLALGLACFIAAYGIASWWHSGDSYHANAAHTFVVGQSSSPVGQSAPNPTQVMSSATLARFLAEDFPEIEHVARILTLPDFPASAGSSSALLESGFADPEFLDIFDFDFVAGDPRGALDEPGSVVLTQEAARRLFGDAPALGQTVLLDARFEATVTGVIRPVRQPSFMGTSEDAAVRFDLLGRRDILPFVPAQETMNLWFATQGWTFVVLQPDRSADAFNAQLPAFVERHIPVQQSAIVDVRLEAFPVGEMTTRALDNLLFSNSTLGLTAVSALLGLGALTLLIASVNYANLATAQSVGRGKEVGLRRVLGAGRGAVMVQSWFDALVQCAVALAVALVALVAAAPIVRVQAGIDLLYFLRGVESVGVIAGLVVLMALVAGAYPALVMSRVRPAEALRTGRAHTGPRSVARILVGIQFATASFLLVVLAVAQFQRSYLEREVLGASEDPVVVLNNVNRDGFEYDTLAAALAGQPGVVSVSQTDQPPWTMNSAARTLARSAEAGASEVSGLIRHVAHDYFETLDQELLAGRTFARDREVQSRPLVAAEDPVPLVIDRAFATALGYAFPAEAVDDIVYAPARLMGDAGAQPVQIIGVVEADRTRVDSVGGVSGYMYAYAPDVTFSGQRRPLVRLVRDNVAAGLQSVERVWRSLAPDVALDIQFTDQLFDQAYRRHARIAQMFILLASTAFVIASIGQLGIAVHVVSRRRHEIAVRKTLGSTALRVARILLIDFSKPILIANLLAWPMAYFAAQTYLAAFSERAPLTPAPFVLSMTITLAIAWAAVAGEVLKAASLRPVEALRCA